MKLGISSYCLSPYLFRGQMTIYDVIDWAKAHGAAHLELVPQGQRRGGYGLCGEHP